MNIRKVVTKGLLAAAMFAALAIVPMALFSATANADSVNWDAIAECESGGNWGINSGNGHYGGLQFKQATWTSNGGVGNPATASRAEQIRVAENVLRTQGIKAWPKCGPRGASPAVWRITRRRRRPVDAGRACCHGHRLRRNALHRFVRLHQSPPDVLRAAQPVGRCDAEFVALRVDPYTGIGPQHPLPAVGHHTLVVVADEFPDELSPSRMRRIASGACRPARRAPRHRPHRPTTQRVAPVRHCRYRPRRHAPAAHRRALDRERAELVALDIGKRDPVRIFAENPGAQIQ